MDFSDRVILQLATLAGRNALFGQDDLNNMLAAAFDIAVAPLQGPYTLIVEKMDLGLEVSRPMLIEGRYTVAPGSHPVELRLRAPQMLDAGTLRVDALFRGSMIAQRVPEDDRITAVTGGFALLDLDRQILDDLGALPAPGPALESERRRRLLARLRQGAVSDPVVNDAAMDAMLHSAGHADVEALLSARGTTELSRFSLSFSTGPVLPPEPVGLSVTIAVLVRDAPLSLATLLAQSRSIREALADNPDVQPGTAAVRRRVPILTLWVVPESLFNDTDWPGATPAARRAAASDLLSGQGIALVAA